MDMSNIPETLQRTVAPSCIYALFRNDMPLIRHLCSFTLVHNALTTSVTMLDESTVLFSNVSNITRLCSNHPPITLPGCRQCIHSLPCGCTFNTSTTYIPPFLSQCDAVSNSTQSPFTHVTNLAVLSEFFSEQDLGHLTASTLLRTRLTASLPAFLRYNENSTEALANIDETKFQLDRAANLSIRRQIAYSSMAEMLSHKNSLAVDDSTDTWLSLPSITSSPLLLLSLALSTFAFVFSIIIGVKLRAFSLLIAMARPSTAVPTHLDFFRTTPLGSTSTTTVTVDDVHFSAVDIAILFTAVCAAVIIGILLCYGYNILIKMTKPTTSIYLQLTTKDTQVYLPFMTLSHDISYYLFAASKIRPSIKVIGCIWPSLHFSWPAFSITNLLLETTLDIPDTIPITFTQARRIRRMLSTGPIVPVLYSLRTGYSRIRPIVFTNVEHAHAPTNPFPPSAPTVSAQSIEQVELQEMPRRLYPVM